ncbi:GGDEF domain-containing protein [Psychromonas sp.]|uniref:sensor domain-containing diguanylate cyclase n=1 Tax=Psychromonas sp. TaxID=1884585 RepID=UPI003A9739C5
MTLTQLPSTSELQLTSIWPVIIKRFIWSYALLAISITLLLTYAYQQYTQNVAKTMLNQEEAFVSSTTQVLQKEMQMQLMVLQMSTRSNVLANFLEYGSPISRKGLETLFINLVVTFNRYDQIRLIDMQGNERIRMNYNSGQPTIVNADNLQNKQDSSYFKESKKLRKGQVYVSAMELNMEYGKVEVPYKPVIRFATPIFNSKGEKLGLMVMNYFANELLEDFRKQMELRISGQGMLIDPQGYWLSNHDRNNEWGASLDNVDQKFKDLYPDAWPTINQNRDGIYHSKSGIFRYVSINPFNLDSIGMFQNEQNVNLTVVDQSKKVTDWKLVIFLPNETINEHSIFNTHFAKVVIVLLYLAAAAILLLLLFISEQKRREIVYDGIIKEELNDLYENSPCGYHSLDKQGIILKINQTELNWLGYQHEEVIGRPFTDFLTPSSITTFERFLAQLQLDNQIEGVVLEIQCKDGHTFFVSTSATSILEKGHFAIARTSAFDITDRIELEERLAYIANTDVLTGISNRRHFFIEAEQYLQSEQDISILMLDADHFKKVNDVYGHDVGDEVLKAIAITLRAALPKEVVLARLGGEEFVIITVGLNAKQALHLSQNICTQMQNTLIPVNGEEDISITLSIGTAQRNFYGEEIDEILKRADIALYQAKATGRNKAIQLS